MADVELINVYKKYDNGDYAVKNVNIDIKDKEFVVLVGPSGCGKSTTLRMIAGLEEISEGTIKIDSRIVNDVEPKDRDISMVFQNYALYPHMNVYDNMAFSLKLKKMDKKIIDEKVHKAAEILHLEDFLDRKPKALSGGQRQRVALGRAIVRNPKVFLMDEPLSNLDAKLRTEMRTEISKLHRELDATFIYVTHDQIEAMTMGDRIVVMDKGEIQQIASPKDLYENPSNRFVAGFIGSPQMNFMDGYIVENDGKLYFKTCESKNVFEIPEEKSDILKKKNYTGKKVCLGIRPEDIKIGGTENKNEFSARVVIREMMGSETYGYFDFNSQEIIVKFSGRTEIHNDEVLKLEMDMDRIHIFDMETEKNIFA